MRLLNAKSKRLHEFFDKDIPPFAILSHVWDEEEVTYEDVKARWPWYRRKAGYAKIRGSCQQALDDDIEYVWIDSCCIDKSSSAELSEAINSMFAWYRDSSACYAYLADVPSREHIYGEGSAFHRSRWFRRGWTLQELLAPSMVRFFDGKWRPLGTKASLWVAIEEATGIGSEYLWGTNLERASIAERMSWAARRETTRKEDMAYCLLGIFGVHMPMLYGEGESAFVRLQEEIIRSSGDHSILAWGYGMPTATAVGHPNNSHGDGGGGILARSPSDFVHCGGVIADRWPGNLRSSHFVATNMGLRIELPVGVDEFTGTPVAVLNCTTEKQYIALPLARAEGAGEDKFERLPFCRPTIVAPPVLGGLSLREFYLQVPSTPIWRKSAFLVYTLALHELGFCLRTVYPPHAVSKISFRRGTIEYVWIYQGSRAMLELEAPGGGAPFTIGIYETGADPPQLDCKMAESPLADLLNIRSPLAAEDGPPAPSALARSLPNPLSQQPARWTHALTLAGLEISAYATEDAGVYGTSSTPVLEIRVRRTDRSGGKAPFLSPPVMAISNETSSESSNDYNVTFDHEIDAGPGAADSLRIDLPEAQPEPEEELSPAADDNGMLWEG